MFHLHLPLLEKIIRPAIVYVALIAYLRLFGKRELAQLNPFDLVVLLSLSNTVQNAIIGDDNSVTGGLVGAFALLSVNWLVMRLLFHMPKLNAAAEGSSTMLICDGVVDEAALKKETMTRQELLSVLHRQSFDSFGEVRKCVLEPNGTFYIEAVQPSADEAQRAELMEALERLTREVQDMRKQLAAKG